MTSFNTSSNVLANPIDLYEGKLYCFLHKRSVLEGATPQTIDEAAEEYGLPSAKIRNIVKMFCELNGKHFDEKIKLVELDLYTEENEEFEDVLDPEGLTPMTFLIPVNVFTGAEDDIDIILNFPVFKTIFSLEMALNMDDDIRDHIVGFSPMRIVPCGRGRRFEVELRKLCEA